MSKPVCFVLDTNILMTDPECIFTFKVDEIVIPIVVLTELDNHKTRQDHVGKNVRAITRTLDSLRIEGSLDKGVKLKTGVLLKVAYSATNLPPHIAPDQKYDDFILKTALDLSKDKNVTLITNDLNVRVRASSLNILATGYDKQSTSFTEFSLKNLEVTNAEVSELLTTGLLPNPFFIDFMKNEYVLFKNNNEVYPCKFDSSLQSFRHVNKYVNYSVFNIKARNPEQLVALDALLDDSVPLVCLIGSPGSGKTLLSLAAGFQRVIEDKQYLAVNILRSVIPVGESLGFLPGTLLEKQQPWVQPVYDLVDLLMGVPLKTGKSAKTHQDLESFGYLKIESLEHLRGKTLPKQWLIIDDAQNISIHEMKTILTRVGIGTKVILTGDPFQIDNPKLTPDSNGFIHALRAFQNTELCKIVYLSHSERSDLASLANILL